MTHVTIGIINYNLGRFLPDAVESALNQTHEARVVVFDDASDDPETKEVLLHLPKEVKLVRHAGNSGSAKWGWESLLRQPTDIIIPLSADDMLYPTAAERLAQVIPEDADWAFADLHHVGEDGQLDMGMNQLHWMPTDTKQQVRVMYEITGVSVTLFAGLSGKWVRDRKLRMHEFKHTKKFMDGATVMNWILEKPRVVYLGANPLYKYRQHGSSESATGGEERPLIGQEVRDFLRPYIDEENRIPRG
jgi:glycosyltransferase involved in cell wall biosynthesis